MSKWERKFGRFAIPNLTRWLILCYVAGYALQFLAPGVRQMLTLNPYAILHGQVWRLVTWLISAPTGAVGGIDLFFVAIMLYFYFSLGTALERIWGTWIYNVYMFTGVFLTIVSSFVVYGVMALLLKAYGGDTTSALALFSTIQAQFVTTYYLNMSIFLAFAATIPNAQVLFMLFIPVKVKWLGYIYGVMLVFEMVECFREGTWFMMGAIAASLINFVIFYLSHKQLSHLNPKQIKRRSEFRQDIRRNPAPKITKHKCAICGQSEEDNPELEFRFCSKCNGNYEYCQQHLFTHEHVK